MKLLVLAFWTLMALAHGVNHYPYQHFGPPLIWFQGPPIIHSPYPFGNILPKKFGETEMEDMVILEGR